MTEQTRPKIFQDSLYRMCILLASSSKSRVMKFGAVLVRDERILGSGINRHIRENDIIRIGGYANHAEISAMNDALLKKEKLSGAVLYVAGHFPDGGLYIPNVRIYTCKSCVKTLALYKVNFVAIPNRGGWVYISVKEAEQMAKDINNETDCISEKRREITLDNISVDMLGLKEEEER